MKSFEKEIKKRILWVALFAALCGLAVVTAFVLKLCVGADSGLPAETLIGFFAGAEVVAAYRIIKYRRALRSGERLEALQIEESDERNRAVALKTCGACIRLTFALLGLAGIVAAFFSRTVFLTIGAVLIALLVLYCVLKAYYSRKF
jgi:predicted lysophospholipase L1 biosynthesis ABC-type transport system permease subunit